MPPQLCRRKHEGPPPLKVLYPYFPSSTHYPSSTSLGRDMPLYAPTLVHEPTGVDLPAQSDIIIAVVGPTGSGKSTFINKAAGIEETEVGHSLEFCTHQVQILRCLDTRQNRQVVFVDTPGFNDTDISGLDVLQLIADWLNLTYERDVHLSGLLFFHRISDNRMGGSPMKYLKILQKLCGDKTLKNVLLVTTMWDEIEEEEGRIRETQFSAQYSVLGLGWHMSRFYNNAESAWDIVSQFQDARCTVLLQKELVDCRLELTETSAGRTLFSLLIEFINKIKELISQIESKLKQNHHSVKRTKVERNKNEIQANLRVADAQRRRYSASSIFRRLSNPRSFVPVNARQPPVRAGCSSHSAPDINLNTTSRSKKEPVATSSANASVVSPSTVECSAPAPSPVEATDMAYGGNTALQGTITALKLVYQIVGLAPVPGLQSLIGLVLNVSEIVNNMYNVDEALVELAQKAGSFVVTLVEQQGSISSISDSNAMKTVIEGLTKEMNRVLKVVERISTQKTAKRLLSAFDKTVIDECNRQMALACGIFGIQIAFISKRAIARIEAKLNMINDSMGPQPNRRNTAPEAMITLRQVPDLEKNAEVKSAFLDPAPQEIMTVQVLIAAEGALKHIGDPERKAKIKAAFLDLQIAESQYAVLAGFNEALIQSGSGYLEEIHMFCFVDIPESSFLLRKLGKVLTPYPGIIFTPTSGYKTPVFKDDGTIWDYDDLSLHRTERHSDIRAKGILHSNLNTFTSPAGSASVTALGSSEGGGGNNHGGGGDNNSHRRDNHNDDHQKDSDPGDGGPGNDPPDAQNRDPSVPSIFFEVQARLFLGRSSSSKPFQELEINGALVVHTIPAQLEPRRRAKSHVEFRKLKLQGSKSAGLGYEQVHVRVEINTKDENTTIHVLQPLQTPAFDRQTKEVTANKMIQSGTLALGGSVEFIKPTATLLLSGCKSKEASSSTECTKYHSRITERHLNGFVTWGFSVDDMHERHIGIEFGTQRALPSVEFEFYGVSDVGPPPPPPDRFEVLVTSCWSLISPDSRSYAASGWFSWFKGLGPGVAVSDVPLYSNLCQAVMLKAPSDLSQETLYRSVTELTQSSSKTVVMRQGLHDITSAVLPQGGPPIKSGDSYGPISSLRR